MNTATSPVLHVPSLYSQSKIYLWLYLLEKSYICQPKSKDFGLHFHPFRGVSDIAGLPKESPKQISLLDTLMSRITSIAKTFKSFISFYLNVILRFQ